MTEEQYAQVVKKEDLLDILTPLLHSVEEKGTFTNWLAALIIACSFGLFGVVLFVPCTAEANILFYMLGATTAVLTTVVTYFFGSSAGSKQKNEVFQTMANIALENSKRRLEIEEDSTESP